MQERVIYPLSLVQLIGPGEKAKFTHMTNQGQDVRFGYYAWYLEDDGKKIVVDAGGTAEMAMAFGRPPNTVTHIQTIHEALDKLGVRPEEVDILVLTHLHLDHIAYIREFPNARRIVQKIEMDFALNPHPTDRFYDGKVFEGLEFDIVEGDVQVTPNVRLIHTPGHTVGGQSVVVETDGGTAVITGFCCIEDNFTGSGVEGGPEVIVPGLHHDVIAAYDSMIRVKRMADIIIQNHDARFADIPHIP